MTTFKELGLSDWLLAKIDKLGFVEPTLIQEKSIKPILEGKDILAKSATGSGKTLAFGCGVLENVKKGQGIQSIILAPTRELAQQVKDFIARLTKDLKLITIYGGVGYGPQIENLKKAEVVIATPGRLLDHIKQKNIDLSNVNLLVLDEADRMLDMGFIADVEKIMSKLPEDKQTLFFSATYGSKINTLIKRYMNDPVKVQATEMVDPKKLTQVYFDVSKNEKLSLLITLLAHTDGLAIVFCNTRRNTEFVAKNLKANKIKSVEIHGGMAQPKRMKSIDMFNAGKIDVLVCTDVAARGLHINGVSEVYNYDLPQDSKDYVHRAGRTARAGKSGKVLNLLCSFDHDNFGRIVTEFRDFDIQKKSVPRLDKINVVKTNDGGRSGSRGGSRGGRSSSSGGRSNGRGSSRSDGRSGRSGSRDSRGGSRSEGRSNRSDRSDSKPKRNVKNSKTTTRKRRI